MFKFWGPKRRSTTLEVDTKHVTLNITAMAQRAGFSREIAESRELLRFAELLVDQVMLSDGDTQRVGVRRDDDGKLRETRTLYSSGTKHSKEN